MTDFNFAVMTDSHLRFDATEGDYWNKNLWGLSADILTAAVDAINALSVDFAIHCGDLTDRSDSASCRRAAAILSRLNCPCYFVPGNHDTYHPSTRSQLAELFGLPAPVFYRAFRVGGWRMLLIDSAYWVYRDGSVKGHYNWSAPDEVTAICVPDFELDWLREELEGDGSVPTICFTHLAMAMRRQYPVGTMPHGKPVEERPVTFSPDSDTPWGRSLKGMLKKAPGVKAFFYGHRHFHDCLIEDGILYCQTGALIEYPNELRRVRVSDGGIDIETVPLLDGAFAERSYLPEWNNRWVAGRPEDRVRSHR
ncbi:MAG: metallophosphoesterase [Candidatus Latescibacterota bacterium]|nr:metallophosphoesterase [Candidatus Latescibacterota bacterium]